MPKTVAIIQARMGSSRLPGKSLAEVLGRPLLDLMVERVNRATSLDQLVLATTTLPRDDDLAKAAQRLGMTVVRGSESDVLSRYQAAVEVTSAEVVVRLTADCPLLDPAVVDRIISVYERSGAMMDLVTNAPPFGRTYPDGMDVEVLDARTLDRIGEMAVNAADREHVTRRLHSPPFATEVVHLHPPAGDVRITVDDVEDLDRVRAIFEQLYPLKPDFDLQDILVSLGGRMPDVGSTGPAGEGRL
jgi:spore coat polysaccharide biosynthesis protein SpsF